MTRLLKDKLTAKGKVRRVLSLDGGGVRGLISLGILKKLEERLERESGDPHYTLSRYFDLIGGTSTGSLIAVGLALGKRVSDIWALYQLICPDLFDKPGAQGFLAPKYDLGKLARALEKEFGRETLESTELKTGLAIHAKRMDQGSAWVLVNNPEWVYYDHKKPGETWIPNCRFELRSLVQASAAAPHYFRGVPLRLMARDATGKETRGDDAFFVDGGVSGQNNPSLELLTMVRDPAYGFEWDLGADKLYMLSLGTGFVRDRRAYRRFDFTPFVMRTVDALRGMIADVSLQRIAYMQALSESGVRWWINGEKRDQSSAPYLTPDGKAALHFQRMDVRLEPERMPADKGKGALMPETAEALLGRPLRKPESKRLADITATREKNLDLLYELGERAGDYYMQAAPPPPRFNPETW